jgi:hypothetical protein
MTRSSRRYDIEVRMRELYDEVSYGTVERFLYTDEEGRDWARIDGEWLEVDDKYGQPMVFVQELPQDRYVERSAA